MNDMQDNAKQNRVVQMLRNLGIYAVGGIGSRLMTFLLVPIYSFFIAPSEFGYYDICFAVIMLMLPFLSMQLRDGAFRFLLDAHHAAHFGGMCGVGRGGLLYVRHQIYVAYGGVWHRFRRF